MSLIWVLVRMVMMRIVDSRMVLQPACSLGMHLKHKNKLQNSTELLSIAVICLLLIVLAQAYWDPLFVAFWQKNYCGKSSAPNIIINQSWSTWFFLSFDVMKSPLKLSGVKCLEQVVAPLVCFHTRFELTKSPNISMF